MRLQSLIDRLPPRVRKAGRWCEHVLATIGLLLIVYHVGFELNIMVSPSMSPTLQGTSKHNGDWILTERVSYWFREPKRWEVIRFDMTDGTRVMKRVVALPGESVTLNKHDLMIDGKHVPQPESLADIKYYPYGNVSQGRTVTCTNGYFVLGDDSIDSQDSRYEGPIPAKEIAGRVWLRVWPLSRFGRVNVLKTKEL